MSDASGKFADIIALALFSSFALSYFTFCLLLFLDFFTLLNSDAITCVTAVGTKIISSSVDGHVRVYDVRQGILHADCIGAPLRNPRQKRPHIFQACLLLTFL